MKKTSLLASVAVLLGSLLFACGGGGGGGSSSSSNTSSTSSTGISSTYTSSGSIGEVLDYTINTAVNPATYSYRIIKSAYGLTGNTGSGVLTSNSDGSYTPSDSPNSKIYALKNGLLVGGVKLNIGGTNTVVPLLGVDSPITSTGAMAGTYNYISTNCTSNANGYPTYPNCSTSYGTLKILADGAYVECIAVNVTDVPSCRSSTGSITSLGNGLFEYIRSGSSNKNYLLGLTASNGQNVLIIDFNDPSGYGYGQATASTQPTTNYVSGAADGTWFANSNSNSSGRVTISGSSFSSVYTGGSNSGTFTWNSPWIGMVATSGSTDTGYALLAGTGVYVYRSNQPSNPYYEIGMLK